MADYLFLCDIPLLNENVTPQLIVKAGWIEVARISTSESDVNKQLKEVREKFTAALAMVVECVGSNKEYVIFQTPNMNDIEELDNNNEHHEWLGIRISPDSSSNVDRKWITSGVYTLQDIGKANKKIEKLCSDGYDNFQWTREDEGRLRLWRFKKGK